MNGNNNSNIVSSNRAAAHMQQQKPRPLVFNSHNFENAHAQYIPEALNMNDADDASVSRLHESHGCRNGICDSICHVCCAACSIDKQGANELEAGSAKLHAHRKRLDVQ